MTKIGGCAFANCTSLKKIELPNGLVEIDMWAFRDCTALRDISIPNSVETVGGAAFYATGYYNNKSNWSNGFLYSGDYLLEVDPGKTGEVTVRDGTKCISSLAFMDCEKITSVILPEGIETICYEAFNGCSKLESINIPKSVRHIGIMAFRKTSLRSVLFANKTGWSISKDSGEEVAMNVNDPSQNAAYLSRIYEAWEWKRN